MAGARDRFRGAGVQTTTETGAGQTDRPAREGDSQGSAAESRAEPRTGLEVAALHPLPVYIRQPFRTERGKCPAGALRRPKQDGGAGDSDPAERRLGAQPAKRLRQNGELRS